MKNIDLTKTEIIDLVLEYSNNDTKKMLFFIVSDCKIKLKIDFYKQIFTKISLVYIYKIFYNNEEFEISIYDNDAFIIDNVEAKTILIELFNLFSYEDIENIKNIILKMKKRKKINKDNKVNVSSVNISNNNTNINNNTSDIKTYSKLRSYIKNSTNIENKTEIINLIKELEKLKEDENKEDYIDKFLELLELLGNVVPIPPAIIKGAKTAKKFFDAIKNKNND